MSAAAADGHEPNLYYNAGATVVFFLLSISLVIKPHLRYQAGAEAGALEDDEYELFVLSMPR